MSKQPVAYLIGGPYDLTKMNVEAKRRVIAMAEPLKVPMRLDEDDNKPIEFRQIEYELVGTAYKCPYSNRDILIYVYSGVMDA